MITGSYTGNHWFFFIRRCGGGRCSTLDLLIVNYCVITHLQLLCSRRASVISLSKHSMARLHVWATFRSLSSQPTDPPADYPPQIAETAMPFSAQKPAKHKTWWPLKVGERHQQGISKQCDVKKGSLGEQSDYQRCGVEKRGTLFHRKDWYKDDAAT